MLRWGVLSSARIGDAFVPSIKAAGHSVVAVASRSEARARDCAKRWRIDRWLDSYEQLLADPDIDVVYIPLPNALHVPWTLSAIDAGKHVLGEKPFALTLSDVDRVAAAAADARVVVAEAFAYRRHPLTERVVSIVREGAIGTPRVVKSAFTFPLTREDDVRLDPALGGGALWDVGCYCVSYARTVLAEEPVEAFGWQVDGLTGVDLTFAGQLRFPSGALLQFDCGFEAPLRTRTEIVGTEGVITVERPFTPELRTTITVNGESLSILGCDARIALVEDMADAIQNAKPTKVSLDDTRGNTAALVALYESARRRQPVSLRS